MSEVRSVHNQASMARITPPPHPPSAPPAPHKLDQAVFTRACCALLYTRVLCVALQNGQTPLHHAASKGHVDIISELLKYGGDPEINDRVRAL